MGEKFSRILTSRRGCIAATAQDVVEPTATGPVQSELDALGLIHGEDGRDQLQNLVLIVLIRRNDVSDDQIFHQ